MSEATVITLWGGQEGARTPYMTRVILGPLRLHVFHRPDADPDMHDHPADFWTFPLTSYVEEVPLPGGYTDWRVVQAFRFHRRRAEHLHRVLGSFCGRRCAGVPLPDPGQIATLVWWGKKRRAWGFQTPNGWIGWRTYCNEPEAQEDRP